MYCQFKECQKHSTVTETCSQCSLSIALLLHNINPYANIKSYIHKHETQIFEELDMQCGDPFCRGRYTTAFRYNLPVTLQASTLEPKWVVTKSRFQSTRVLPHRCHEHETDIKQEFWNLKRTLQHIHSPKQYVKHQTKNNAMQYSMLLQCVSLVVNAETQKKCMVDAFHGYGIMVDSPPPHHLFSPPPPPHYSRHTKNDSITMTVKHPN